jgi:glutathione-regulated potassium-efflux system ancillary protein KefC
MPWPKAWASLTKSDRCSPCCWHRAVSSRLSCSRQLLGAKVFSAETASLLIGAVAVSMLVSPLLLVLIDKILLPRYAKCSSTSTLEEIAEQQDAPVIVLGFGRYGQIVARMMLSQGIGCTVLDHDVEMIETARKFGYRVFYGDASRLDLLRIAGAGDASIVVVAVDDVDQSMGNCRNPANPISLN